MEYTYRCYRCNFNLHVRCASLLPTLEAEFHDHPLTPIWKWITFTCDLCGIKEDKGMPYLCNPCGLLIHRKCAYFPRRLKVVCHKHPLHITHSSLELDESNSRFCLLCVQKVDTRYGLYYCSKCDFVAHLNCTLDWRNREDINLLEIKDGENEDAELNQCVESATAYKSCNGFLYTCQTCHVELDVQCSLLSDILIHEGHKHQLFLSFTGNEQSCSSCGSKIYFVFRCTTCEFALDFKCATLPQTTRYKQHEHPFNLSYTAEDDSGEYYYNICEEERNSNHWFYYCADCTYPAHPEYILGKYPNRK
ncbi:uncharacterized protein LOC115980479 [Quercus lobata]|uniref:uncharacterized protein LOC115980479 n=1 Tax=Quercus lobata TaxID=97700 RepID=UPI001246FA2E|nr:uncharacterized protein LOC115980479 [Quercus lobata]